MPSRSRPTCLLATRLLATGLLGACVLALPAAAHAAPGTRTIRIDAGTDLGPLRPLQGVNGVPDPGHAKPFTYGAYAPRSQSIDVSKGYLAARIRLVRTHDSYGAGDIDAHFLNMHGLHAPTVPPSFDVGDLFPNQAADPADPRSYNFGPTDQIIRAIGAIGADTLFRVGRSEGADAAPPRDIGRYAEIVRHVAMHYETGWDGGFQHAVRYWEIWNEPDLGHLFWGGTPQQYYALYDQVSRAIKSVDPASRVGGPTLARIFDQTPFREGFLDHIRASGAPLDFYSWHLYSLDSDDPFDFVRASAIMQKLLETHGFGTVPQFLDEWNGGAGFGYLGPRIVTGAFEVAAMIYMQDSPIAEQTLYRADEDFGADGHSPDARGTALIAHGAMQRTPIRIRAAGGDDQGFALLAGRSADRTLYQILIANTEIPASAMGARKGGDVMVAPGLFSMSLLPRRTLHYRANQGFAITLSGLPARAGGYTLTEYRLDATHDLVPVRQLRVPGNLVRIADVLAPPSVALLTIRANDAPAGGRP